MDKAFLAADIDGENVFSSHGIYTGLTDKSDIDMLRLKYAGKGRRTLDVLGGQIVMSRAKKAILHPVVIATSFPFTPSEVR